MTIIMKTTLEKQRRLVMMAALRSQRLPLNLIGSQVEMRLKNTRKMAAVVAIHMRDVSAAHPSCGDG